MTTINTNIQIPSFVTSSPMISIISGGSYSDSSIQFSPIHTDFLSMWIIEAEMREFRRLNPLIDINKVQEMINSTDVEMWKLGLEILKTCKYTHKIILCKKNAMSAEYVIQEFVNNNQLNITGKIL